VKLSDLSGADNIRSHVSWPTLADGILDRSFTMPTASSCVASRCEKTLANKMLERRREASGQPGAKTKKLQKPPRRIGNFWSNPNKVVGQTACRCARADLSDGPLRLVCRMRSVAEAMASANG
jgi:hypothetical protein